MPQLTLSQIAYTRIREAIVTGKLDFGEPLSESSLSLALGMSKAPIRSALIDLQSAGLVNIVPMSGTYVTSPVRDEVIELCDHRLLLERQALLHGAVRNPTDLVKELSAISERMKDALRANDVLRTKLLDGEYHASFFKYAGNRYLAASYEAIRSLVEALRFRFMDTAIYRSRAAEEHALIAAAIENGDMARMSRLIDLHIARTKEYQSGITWVPERLTRKDYRSRDYADLFGTATDAP